MSRTLEQKIADAEARLQRLKAKSWRRCQNSDCIVRSPQPQRPSVSERVGEEAEVNQSPG
nr:hypothetical protein [Escherichia coli]